MIRNIMAIVTTVYRNIIGRPIKFHCLNGDGFPVAKAYWIKGDQYEVLDIVDEKPVGDSVRMSFSEIQNKFEISIPE